MMNGRLTDLGQLDGIRRAHCVGWGVVVESRSIHRVGLKVVYFEKLRILLKALRLNSLKGILPCETNPAPTRLCCEETLVL